MKESDTIFKSASASSVCNVVVCQVVKTDLVQNRLNGLKRPVYYWSGVVLHLSDDAQLRYYDPSTVCPPTGPLYELYPVVSNVLQYMQSGEIIRFCRST